MLIQVQAELWMGAMHAFCAFLLSNRGEHGRVPTRDVHRSCAAGPHAVVAQEAEGELFFLLTFGS